MSDKQHCDICGSDYDPKKLDEVLFHANNPHRPIEATGIVGTPITERREYEMSEEQYQRMLEVGRPGPYLVAGGMPPPSRQEAVNDAWLALGVELECFGSTAEPIPGKGDRFFSATPRRTTAEGKVAG